MKFGVFIIIAIALLGGLFYFLSPKPQVVKRPVANSAVSVVPSQALMKNVPLVIKNKALVSGDKVITLTEGEQVTITVTADADDELHIHGYDKEVILKKDIPVNVSFTANLTGRFPLELHDADIEIAVLEVQPK